jgi:phospholipase/lecithinase/hemolysin
LTIFQLDAFALFQQIVASPASFGLVNVTQPSDPAYNPYALYANPDTYLFWDTVHPTTRGHKIIADAATQLISQQCNATGKNCVYPVH